MDDWENIVVQTKPILTFLTTLLMVKILIVILLGYRDYFPATFESGFLAGREAYFYGVYRWVLTILGSSRIRRTGLGYRNNGISRMASGSSATIR